MSLHRRLTSVAMAFALSGSPAVLSACMALCLQGVATAAPHEGGAPAGHAAHAPGPVPAAASVHAHHGSPASNEPAANATNSATSHEGPDARLSAICSNCCSDGLLALVADAGVERVNALTLGAGPAASQVTSCRLTASVVAASPPSPPVPPPSPPRAPLVLRI